MKTLFSLAVAAVTALSFAGVARADDVQTSKTESKKEVGKNKTKMTTETEEKDNPGGLMKSTTETSKSEKSSEAMGNGHVRDTSEKTEKQSAPGMKTRKSHTKHAVEKDTNGNVVKDETIKQ